MNTYIVLLNIYEFNLIELLNYKDVLWPYYLLTTYYIELPLPGRLLQCRLHTDETARAVTLVHYESLGGLKTEWQIN